MSRLMKICGSIITVLAGVRLLFAYIDPNTGGMLFQFLAIILASLTGILLFFSRQIQVTIARVRRALRGNSTHTTDAADNASVEGNDKTFSQ